MPLESSAMKWLTAAGLVGLLITNPAKAGESVVSSEAAGEFLSTDFRPVSAFQDLPVSVQSFLTQRISEEMAPVGGEYEPTDFHLKPGLPSRRLIASGSSSELVFLWYEHGGRGHHQHFVLLGTEANSVTLKLTARGQFGNTLEQLRSAIASGTFSPETSVADKNGYW